MKFRVIFLKKKYIYYSILIAVVLILILIVTSIKNTTPTFNIFTDTNILSTDVTGDGKKDLIYIKPESEKYSIEINTNDKTLPLTPDKKLSTLGTNSPGNPIKVILMDISRDKTPEIFIQSSQQNTPIQHTFMWNNGKFDDIFCSSNNVLGFMDCGNNKTPKFLSGKLSDSGIELYGYILVKDKLHSFPLSDSNSFMGKDSIFTFINYIEGLPHSEAYKPANIFYPGLTGNDLSLIGKLSGENNTYKFQSLTFKDSKWNKDGQISETRWNITFKAIPNNNKDLIKNYTLFLTLRPFTDENGTVSFKIVSMSYEKK